MKTSGTNGRKPVPIDLLLLKRLYITSSLVDVIGSARKKKMADDAVDWLEDDAADDAAYARGLAEREWRRLEQDFTTVGTQDRRHALCLEGICF